MPTGAQRVLEVARAAGRAAGALCRQVQARVPEPGEAMAKAGDEPVTIADYGSQALILRAIRQTFPEHAVRAEEGAEHLREVAGADLRADLRALVGRALESAVAFDEICDWVAHRGRSGSEVIWVIDPIDGTKGFLRRQHYAVAIGVLWRQRPWVGVLVCPNLRVDGVGAEPGVLFAAVRGEGTTCEPMRGGAAGEVRVSDIAAPSAARVLASVESAHGDPRLLTEVIGDAGLRGGVVRLDSQAKYGVVASGGAELYLRPQSRPDYRERVWDHAAGALIVEEAGGRVTDLDGRPLDFGRGARLEGNRGVVATNGLLHETVLESLQRLEA